MYLLIYLFYQDHESLSLYIFHVNDGNDVFLPQIEFIGHNQMYFSAELTEKYNSLVRAVMVSDSEAVLLRKSRVRAGHSRDVALLFEKHQN